GPNDKLSVPKEAKIWNPSLQKWENVGEETLATSKVTFDFELSNWHNGEKMDMQDILHSLYFIMEWGIQTDENDKTFDAEFTPRAAQSTQTIIGVNSIDEDTVEVYVDYWHFDEGEIADWAVLWSSVPWEITSAMEKAVTDGKVSFSRSGATSKNVSWLSLIIPNDAKIVRDYLLEFKNSKYIPHPLKESNQDMEYYQKRYEASIKWIEEKNHAVISNGPFYLETYSPESRTIKVTAFDDDSYPLKLGRWSEFEKPQFPSIKRIEMEKIVKKGEEFNIIVNVENSDSVLYFLTGSEGIKIKSETLEVANNNVVINIPSEVTSGLGVGANNIKIVAISNAVLKPDFYESSFLVTDINAELPKKMNGSIKLSENNLEYVIWIMPIILISGILLYLKKRNHNNP
ncbi:MAG: ABC transporter substrate-binding protein, partial [Nitrosopumilus sp.]|nr:ABC transporter substrate-binding protein [Nitrosopumilus sp.]